MNLREKLLKYSKRDVYPFHMPGHKRQKSPLEDSVLNRFSELDITDSIEDFCTLGEREGPIYELEKRAALIFGVKNAHLLVNGSSCGVLAAISCFGLRGKKVLIGRNAHKSAYNALLITGGEADYLWPDIINLKNGGSICGAADCQKLAERLDRDRDIAAFFLTSPTYEGVCSDIREIAKICHERGVALIVDAAHGAHFGFAGQMPSAQSQGADIVITSIHKTLPAPTQTAFLFTSGSSFIDQGLLKKMLTAYQTSSPSFILMAGACECLDILEEKGEELFGAYAENLREFYDRTAGLKRLWLQRQDDPGKILVCMPEGGLKNCRNSHELTLLLREKYGIEPEMTGETYVLLMTSLMDSKESFSRLAEALYDIEKCEAARECSLHNITTGTKAACDFTADNFAADSRDSLHNIYKYKISCIAGSGLKNGLTLREAMCSEKNPMPLGSSTGFMAADFIYAYPPGIPVLLPGEMIDEKALSYIERLLRENIRLKGLELL